MNRCDTCAFGKDCGAAIEPNNRLKGMIAALGGFPFFCHHKRDGTEYDWRSPGNAAFWALARSERRICAGWKQHVGELAQRGFFDERKLRPIRRTIGELAIAHLAEFIAAKNRNRKRKAKTALKRCLKFLAKKSIAKEKIPL